MSVVTQAASVAMARTPTRPLTLLPQVPRSRSPVKQPAVVPSTASSEVHTARQQLLSARQGASDGLTACTRRPSTPEQHNSKRQGHVAAQIVTGAHTLKGLKRAIPGLPNQDSHLILQVCPGITLAAVFDGHGLNGHLASARVRGLVEQHAAALVDTIGSRSGATAFARLFNALHETLVAEKLAQYSGTTASIALIDTMKGVATIAHVGDSTIMVSSGADVDFATREHKVDDEARKRVQALGGEVRETLGGSSAGEAVKTARVYAAGSDFPGLAMARALGDQEAHALGVTHEPEVATVPFRPGSSLILASDGFWDQISTHATAQSISACASGFRQEDATSAARSLVNQARERWQPDGDIDDITVVVVTAATGPALSAPTGLAQQPRWTTRQTLPCHFGRRSACASTARPGIQNRPGLPVASHAHGFPIAGY